MSSHCTIGLRGLLTFALCAMQLVLVLAADKKCNGFSELCSRPFNEVSHISTHASFATVDSSNPSLPGTQYKDIKQQLNDGVRGLHLDIYKGSTAGSVDLCFPDCSVINGGTLAATLEIVKAWLDDNPNEVVTIFLDGAETTADPSAVEQAFVSSGIDTYMLPSKKETGKWPTLEKMIADGTRLVVFAESPAISDYKQHFIKFKGIVLKLDGPFTYGAEWTCGPWTRSTESILLIPHLIVQTATISGAPHTNLPYPFNLDTTNGYQLEYHAITCRGGQSIWMNFVEVDFYDKGDVWTPTKKFNALPYEGDDVDNFYPEFFDAKVDSDGRAIVDLSGARAVGPAAMAWTMAAVVLSLAVGGSGLRI